VGDNAAYLITPFNSTNLFFVEEGFTYHQIAAKKFPDGEVRSVLMGLTSGRRKVMPAYLTVTNGSYEGFVQALLKATQSGSRVDPRASVVLVPGTSGFLGTFTFEVPVNRRNLVVVRGFLFFLNVLGAVGTTWTFSIQNMITGEWDVLGTYPGSPQWEAAFFLLPGEEIVYYINFRTSYVNVRISSTNPTVELRVDWLVLGLYPTDPLFTRYLQSNLQYKPHY